MWEIAEALDYYEAPWDFDEALEALFGEGRLDDLTDIDREEVLEYSFLVALGPDGPRLSSEELDAWFLDRDAYFLNICISREKPLAYKLYWKYPKEGRGQDLVLAESPFLPDHAYSLDLFDRFVRQEGLLALTSEDMLATLDLDGESQTLYYKYFNRLDDDSHEVWRTLKEAGQE